MVAPGAAPHERRWFNVPVCGELYSPRTGHTVVEHGGRFYLFGGTDKQRRQQDLYVFDVSSSRWTRLQARGEIPSRRSGALGTEYDGKMYVFGGYEGREQQYFNTIHCFDFEACQWTLVRPEEPRRELIASNTNQSATRPHPRTDHCLIGHAGKLVVFGGYDGTARFQDSWSFDLASRSWRELATRQRPEEKPSRRFGHSGVAFGGRLWVFGGWDGRETLDCVWSLDLATEVWSSLDGLRVQRSLTDALSASVVAAAAIELNRGDREPPRRARNGNKRTRTTYDLRSGRSGGENSSVFAKYDLRSGRSGGENSSAFANIAAVSDPLEEEQESQACSGATPAATAAAELAKNPCNRYRHSCVVQGGAMVVFGGVDKEHKRFNDLHRFDFDSLTWSQVSVAGPLPSARTFHRAVALGDSMYITGGYDGHDRLNDMFYVHLGALSPASLSELCAEVVRSHAAELGHTGQLQRVPPMLLDSVVWTRDHEGVLRGGRSEDGVRLCPRLALAPSLTSVAASPRSPGDSLSSDDAQVAEEKRSEEPQQQCDADGDHHMEGDAPQGKTATAASTAAAALLQESCCTLCGAPARAHELVELVDEDSEMLDDESQCCEPDLELAAQAEVARAAAERKREEHETAPDLVRLSASPDSVAWLKTRSIFKAVGLRRS